MAKRCSKIPPPRFPWSVLASIPLERLLEASELVGHEPKQFLAPGRLAVELIREGLEWSILEQLNARELHLIGITLGIPLGRVSKAAMIAKLIKPYHSKLKLQRYGDDLPEQLTGKERTHLDEALIEWAKYYIKAADDDGEYVAFTEFRDDITPVESTVRLICSLWPDLHWPDWLSWQTYGGPSGPGPWWVLRHFDDTPEWLGATLYLRDPWDFPFAWIFQNSTSDTVGFTIERLHSKTFRKRDHEDLARAILNGMDDERAGPNFCLACHPERHGLAAVIRNPDSLTEYDANIYKRPAKDGIYWF